MDEMRLARCTLRSWREGDAASLARHANNRKVWLNMRDLFPHPYTLDDARGWIATGSRAEGLVSWAIVVDGEAIGGIGLVLKSDVDRRTAELGYWLGEAYWGRGIATEALRAVTDWAFAGLDLARLEAGVFEWNPASARVLEKAGYTLEARQPKAVTKDGRTIDRLLYARLRPQSPS
ncbi:MAG: GNAT family N-acetyltransferase [Candidatus Rokuibacteriota bacterium]